MIPTEHQEQCALVEWVDIQARTKPEIGLLFAVPNCARTSMGTARKLKREGLRKGVPDLMLPVAKRGMNGLFIEMKRQKGGRLSPEQKWWFVKLIEQGYAVHRCNGWEQARDAILDYLEAA